MHKITFLGFISTHFTAEVYLFRFLAQDRKYGAASGIKLTNNHEQINPAWTVMRHLQISRYLFTNLNFKSLVWHTRQVHQYGVKIKHYSAVMVTETSLLTTNAMAECLFSTTIILWNNWQTADLKANCKHSLTIVPTQPFSTLVVTQK